MAAFDHSQAGTNGRRMAIPLGVFALAILLVLVPYLPGLLGAAVLYVMVAPVHRWLARVVPARLSAAALAALLLLLLLVPGGWLLSTALVEASEALLAVQRSAVLSGARAGNVDWGEQLSSGGAQLVSWLSGQAVALFGSATRATLNLCIALLGLYYLLVGGDGFVARLRRLLPVSDAVFERLRERFVAVTEAMLIGTFLTAALQGTLVGAAFALVGLPAPVFWGMITACAAVLPVMGSALVWLPAAGWLATQGRWGAAAFMLGAGAIVVSNLDNVVWLIVYKRVSGIHPMVTLVGALAGMRLFGVLGVLFGPLALCWFLELLAVYEELARPPACAAGTESGPPRVGAAAA